MGIGFAPRTQFVIVIQKQHFKNVQKFELLISDQTFEYLLQQNVSSYPVFPVSFHLKYQTLQKLKFETGYSLATDRNT